MKSILSLSAAFVLAIASFTASAVNPLDALSGIVSNLTSTTNFQISDIVGTWEYQSPAVSFKSDDALSKIGGVAASTALEDKLKTYYTTAGLNTLVLTVNSDDTFSMKIKSISLTGTITKDDDSGNLTFNFSAFGKISIGKVSAMAEKSATNNLTLTFDVSRLITILDKVAEVAKIQSIQTLTSLLKNYDGLYAGARLKKTGSASSTSSTNSQTNSNGSNGSASKAADALKGLFGK